MGCTYILCIFLLKTLLHFTVTFSFLHNTICAQSLTQRRRQSRNSLQSEILQIQQQV